MYNNYTPLQQRQLALQEYSNTQSTYLLVCASARSTALKATLTDQLHRKFRLVDRLDGELTASVDGALLAAEDVELMSTALMYFAKALQEARSHPAGPAPLRARHLRRGCVFDPRQTCLYYEPCAGYDRCAHRAGECRAGAAQHGV